MALHLPDCLRWDYGEPYPKSFILCGNVIHYWNGGETEGHVEEIEAKREPGLDLLLVPVDELQRRYTASSKRTPQGVVVTLRPTEASEFVVEATLEIDAKLDRLRVLRYVDPEGNRTEFVALGLSGRSEDRHLQSAEGREVAGRVLSRLALASGLIALLATPSWGRGSVYQDDPYRARRNGRDRRHRGRPRPAPRSGE